MRKLTKVLAVVITAAAAIGLTACSSGDSTSSGPVTITYWGGPNTDKVAALWNKTHKDIQVKAEVVQNGPALLTKVLTAIKAGSGAPDVVGLEYTNIPTLVAAGAVTDLSKYGASSLKDKFAPSYWNAVSLGTDSVYGIPVDAGPEMFFYRKDIFDSLGLAAPKTWDDYTAAAQKIHASDPTRFIGTFDATAVAQNAGLMQQNGNSWWGKSGDSWSVSIDDAAGKKVMSYWGDLVQKGLVDTVPQFTPEWNSALNSGAQVGWISAAWAPGVLAGVAPDTQGKWAAAPLPQWKAGDNATGNWGGGTNVVTSQTKHPQQAEQFAAWLTSSKEGLTSFIKEVGIFPAAIDSFGALDAPPAFLSGQKDFYDLAGQSLKGVQPVTFGPNYDVAATTFTDEFGKAVSSKNAAEFDAALATVQNTVEANLKKSGYKVK